MQTKSVPKGFDKQIHHGGVEEAHIGGTYGDIVTRDGMPDIVYLTRRGENISVAREIQIGSSGFRDRLDVLQTLNSGSQLQVDPYELGHREDIETHEIEYLVLTSRGEIDGLVLRRMTMEREGVFAAAGWKHWDELQATGPTLHYPKEDLDKILLLNNALEEVSE